MPSHYQRHGDAGATLAALRLSDRSAHMIRCCIVFNFFLTLKCVNAFGGISAPKIRHNIYDFRIGNFHRLYTSGTRSSEKLSFVHKTTVAKVQSLDSVWAEYDGEDVEDSSPRQKPNPLIPAERYTSADWLKCLISLPFSFALQRVSSHLLANTVFAIMIWACYCLFPKTMQFLIAGLNPTPHMLLGSALGLLLVFRTNTAYDRFWEARKLWGFLISRTREVANFEFSCLHESADETRAAVPPSSRLDARTGPRALPPAPCRCATCPPPAPAEWLVRVGFQWRRCGEVSGRLSAATRRPPASRGPTPSLPRPRRRVAGMKRPRMPPSSRTICLTPAQDNCKGTETRSS